MNKLLKKTKKGFTLVELLVVIAILAVLASVSVVGYLGFTTKARNSNAMTELAQAREVIRAELLDGKNEVFSFEDDTLYVKANADYTDAISTTTPSGHDSCKKATEASKAGEILAAEFTKTTGFKIFGDVADLGGTFYFINVEEVKGSGTTTVISYKVESIVYTSSNGGIATWTMGSGINAGGTVLDTAKENHYNVKSGS